VTFTEYRVTGKRQYRGHDPGTTFEANLDVGPEQRAIARGDIRIIRRVTPGIQPGSVRSPDGWLPVTTTGQEGRR
jgi:hypothetical protein